MCLHLNISRRVAVFVCENDITSRGNQSISLSKLRLATLKVLISHCFEGKRKDELTSVLRKFNKHCSNRNSSSKELR